MDVRSYLVAIAMWLIRSLETYGVRRNRRRSSRFVHALTTTFKEGVFNISFSISVVIMDFRHASFCPCVAIHLPLDPWRSIQLLRTVYRSYSIIRRAGCVRRRISSCRPQATLSLTRKSIPESKTPLREVIFWISTIIALSTRFGTSCLSIGATNVSSIHS